MSFQEALYFVESALSAKTGKLLTEPEKQILKAAWSDETYTQLADSLYLSIGHIKDLAYPLWQRISDVLGIKVSKNNFRYVLKQRGVGGTRAPIQIISSDIEQPEEPKGNILIVDDLLDNLRLLTDIFTKQGYKVRSITNGKLALRTVVNNPPDVILLDIKMPIMDGYQVCEALKADERTSEIPVIFLSALDEVLDKVKAFKVGGVDYITKPFEPEEVIARIQTQLTVQKQKLQLRQDIERHQQTAEIVYQSRAILASLLNGSQDGIAAMQAVRNLTTGKIDEFRCLVTNPVFATMLGKQREDLMGNVEMKKLLNHINPGLFDSLVRVVETGEPLEQELEYENNYIRKCYQFFGIKFGDGVSITCRDITELNQLKLKVKEYEKLLS